LGRGGSSGARCRQAGRIRSVRLELILDLTIESATLYERQNVAFEVSHAAADFYIDRGYPTPAALL
jgi:hypothetical protein